MSVLEILQKKKIITAKEASEIEKESSEKGKDIRSILEERGIESDTVSENLSEFFGIPHRKLKDKEISPEDLSYIPEESALHYKIVPLGIKDGVLEVGIGDPDNIEAKDALNFISSKIGLPYKLFLISNSDFESVLSMYRSFSEEITKSLEQLGGEGSGVSIDSQGDPENKEEDMSQLSSDGNKAKIVETAPITKIVATILRYATEGNASDVHLEPMKNDIRVRFRVDGVLNTSLILPYNVHPALVARIKILAKIKLDEKRKPQDGRFSARIEDRKVDFRVSTFPTYFGEKVVLRILDQEKGVKSLDHLGLSPNNTELIREALKKPYGLILISGPTGSGKTTTLYSMLKELDREKYNVLSLEDPIEYNIEGVNQSQVHPDIDYTFATGLRTTLRQDPDIIMVGEIRDAETAGLAIQASLTGHLVLATIHTNNAVGVIPRLIDMHVDPYLIAPTLILAIAQRLVGVLCPDSGEAVPIEGKMKEMIDNQFGDLPAEYREKINIPKEVYKIKPTTQCPTGTKGRLAVMEVLKMDKDIENIVLSNASEIEISKMARSKGMLTMKDDALIKAFNREIPIEEVLGL